MGRLGLPEREHFIITNHTPAEKNVKWLECKHCRRAYNADPDCVSLLVLVKGRPRYYLAHLGKCEFYKESAAAEDFGSAGAGSLGSKRSALDALSDLSTQSGSDDNPTIQRRVARPIFQESPADNLRPRKQAKSKPTQSNLCPDKPARPRQLSAVDVRQMERLLAEFQADNCLPDSFIERNSTRMLFEFLFPSISDAIPNRKSQGGRILDANYDRSRRKATEALHKTQQKTGGRVGLLSDVWQNVWKEHLLGCQLTLYGCTLSYALDQMSGSRHHGVAIARQLEGVLWARKTIPVIPSGLWGQL